MWEIRSNAHFRQSPPNGDTTGPLKTAFYVQVDPTGHAGSLSGENISYLTSGARCSLKENKQSYI
jgi:hypothetical protein